MADVSLTTNRQYYDENSKPKFKDVFKKTTKDGDFESVKTYHPGGDEDKIGNIFSFSNGVEVTRWDCQDGNGNVTKAQSIKGPDFDYIDWDGDGLIDCIDTIEEVLNNETEDIPDGLIDGFYTVQEISNSEPQNISNDLEDKE